jgi:hypothetical protein
MFIVSIARNSAMTEDNVLLALDAFIVTFEPDQPEPKSHRSQSHERETYGDSDIKKERGEREREEGSRVESYNNNNNGSFGPATTTPAFPPVFEDQSRASRAGREMRWHLGHGERVPRNICASCRRPITPGQSCSLMTKSMLTELTRALPAVWRDYQPPDLDLDRPVTEIEKGLRWDRGTTR